MAERLYIFSTLDLPHVEGPLPGLTVCGRDLSTAREITEGQAEVYLDDRRCGTCCPQHTARHGHGAKHG
jgi:hypothetical protein